MLLIPDRHRPTRLTVGEEVSEARVAVTPGLDLRARLVDRDGQPLAGHRVLFVRALPTETARHDLATVSWVEHTDADGRLDFSWVEPKIPLLGFVEVGGRFVCFSFRNSADPLQLGEIEVTDRYGIRGVVHAADQSPASGAWVLVRPELPRGEELEQESLALVLSRATVADRGGAFEVRGLMPGRYEVLVRQPGSAIARRTAVAGLDPEPVALHLGPARRVRGTVFGGDGKPVHGVTVLLRQDPRHAARRLRWGGTMFQATTRTRPDGSFAFGDIPDGVEFVLRAYRNRNGALEQAELLDVQGDGEPLELTLTRQ